MRVSAAATGHSRRSSREDAAWLLLLLHAAIVAAPAAARALCLHCCHHLKAHLQHRAVIAKLFHAYMAERDYDGLARCARCWLQQHAALQRAAAALHAATAGACVALQRIGWMCDSSSGCWCRQLRQGRLQLRGAELMRWGHALLPLLLLRRHHRIG